MFRLLVLFAALLCVTPGQARAESARPFMDQWITGNEPDHFQLTMKWAKEVTDAARRSMTSRKFDLMGTSCFPERNVCEDSVSVEFHNKDKQVGSYVTYTIAGSKDAVIGRKMCVTLKSGGRLCGNWYSAIVWIEELDGTWKMIGEPWTGSRVNGNRQ